MKENFKFDLWDIALIPSIESHINSRMECDVIQDIEPFISLPLMASPMDTVVCKENFKEKLH